MLTEAGNLAIVRSLISHGAVQKMDTSGCTPIMSASKSGNKELEALLKNLKIDYADVSTKEKPKEVKVEERVSSWRTLPRMLLIHDAGIS